MQGAACNQDKNYLLIFDLPGGKQLLYHRFHFDTQKKNLFLLLYFQKSTYGWPLLCQPGGAVEGVAGLQDGRLRGVQTLPLISGSDGSLHVLLHTGHRAALDASATGSRAGGPGAALPSVIVRRDVSWPDSCIQADVRVSASSPRSCVLTEAEGGRGHMA